MSAEISDLKILIVDDEVLIAEDIKDILKGFGCKHIDMAHSNREAQKKLELFQPDLVLLDIRMETEFEGLELAQLINESSKVPFIYITAHSDVSTIQQIIKTKPFAYITKPIKKSDLFANLNLLVEKKRSESNSVLQIKDGYKTVIIPLEDILYIEGEGNYINIYTKDKKWVSRQSLESLINDLKPGKFARIHRSYIVNVEKVQKYSKKEVEINGVHIPVSRNIGEELDNLFKTK